MIALQDKKTIGLLGGMGPLASANIYHKIIKLGQEIHQAEQDADFPPIIIYNLPLIGFDQTGFTNPDLVKEQLINGVKKLEQAGSDFIIIACNTVHHFDQQMSEAIMIPIISIIEETAKAVAKKGLKTVGLLSSESTNRLDLYQHALARYDIESVSVTDEHQKWISDIIFHVMSGSQGASDKQQLKHITNELEHQGAQGVIIGCTELPLVFSQQDTTMTVFDSNEIIAGSALKQALGF